MHNFLCNLVQDFAESPRLWSRFNLASARPHLG